MHRCRVSGIRQADRQLVPRPYRQQPTPQELQARTSSITVQAIAHTNSQHCDAARAALFKCSAASLQWFRARA